MKERLNEARREFDKACDDHIARYGRNAKVYISGPMSNLSREQYMELFRRAEQSLRDRGYQHIVNPIRVWACRWPWLYRLVGYRITLLYDLWLLMRVTRYINCQDGETAEVRTLRAAWRITSRYGPYPNLRQRSSTNVWRNYRRNGVRSKPTTIFAVIFAYFDAIIG